MKIALDARALRAKGGGISLCIYKIADYILNNTEVSLILFCSEGLSYEDIGFNDKFRPRARFVNLNPDGMGPSQACYDMDMNVIPDLIREHNIDLYHACANWGISSPEITVPSLLTVHDVIPFFVREGVFEDDKHFALYEKLIKTSTEHADRLITVSHYSKQAIIEKLGTDENKIEVVYNGMDRDARAEDYKGKGGKLLDSLDLTREKYFIYIGGFYERKNVMRMVEAFRRFLREYPDYKLVVTGDSKSGEYVRKRYAMFREEAADIETSICSPGYISREDLNMLVANSAALVYPSINEGFGIPILEAMSLDVPALCSDNTVLPEVGQEAAVYFDPFNVDDIAQSMINIVRDEQLREEKVGSGRKRAGDFS